MADENSAPRRFHRHRFSILRSCASCRADCCLLFSAKQCIDFLLRPEIQKLLATGGVEASVRETIPSLNNIKSMEVDYGKLVSESKKLSQGFLKEWIKTEE